MFFKKIIPVALCTLLLVSSLTACSMTTPGETTQATTTVKAAETSAAASAAVTDATVKVNEGPYKIGMSTLNLSNPFFVALTNAAKDYAAKNNAELFINDSQDSAEKQVTAIENFIASGCDAIIVTAVDPEAILPAVQAARAQGIKVIAHTTKLAEYDAWVAADEYDMGYTLGITAGEWIAANLGDGEIQAATLNFDTIPQVINRKKGIIEGVLEKAPNVKFVADATAGDPQAGMEATENFIQTYPDLQVLLGINDGGALGGYEAFMAAGKTGDKYLVGGIDATPEGIAKVKEGGIYRVTIDQAPVTAGQKCVELALKAIKGESFEKDYLQALVPVTAANVADY